MQIREATMADAEGILSVYAPYVAGSHSTFELEIPKKEAMEQRLERTLRTHPWLVAETDRVVGYAYGAKHRARQAYQWSVEVSCYVDEQHVGRGVGRSLYQPLLCLLEAQGFANAYAGVSLPNDGSVAFHEAFGFKHLGTFTNVGYKQGTWHDVAWYQRPLKALATVSPPRLLRELRRDGTVARVLTKKPGA